MRYLARSATADPVPAEKIRAMDETSIIPPGEPPE